MDRSRSKAERGFTLVELLVVIAIIGILAAIAIPQFAAYRRRGYDSDVKSNVRNMATVEDAYYVDYQTYAASIAALAARGFKQSANVGAATPAASATTFVVSATAVSGCSSSTGVWSFSSTGMLTGVPCN